ncbi:MAG: hypothetical protein LBD31_06350 [Treponema sp.]|jgi:hypothetical protein|nr:hypothetical protein [Treponema sp.]
MGAGAVFTGLIEKIKAPLSRMYGLVISHLRIVLIAGGALLVIIVLLIVLALKTVLTASPSAASTAQTPVLPGKDPAVIPGGPVSPAEDFFLPYEPDFVPGVLLEREPRTGWAEEDARPFWSDPMEGNEEAWRKRIESGIDALLEQVP